MMLLSQKTKRSYLLLLVVLLSMLCMIQSFSANLHQRQNQVSQVFSLRKRNTFTPFVTVSSRPINQQLQSQQKLVNWKKLPRRSWKNVLDSLLNQNNIQERHSRSFSFSLHATSLSTNFADHAAKKPELINKDSHENQAKSILSKLSLKKTWKRIWVNNKYDREILNIAIPTLGAVLIDPMLSLVDTMFVGKLGPENLGAMGPCTALYGLVFGIVSCIFLVSTSVNVAKYKGVDDSNNVGKTIASGITIATILGSILAFAFIVCPRFFLKLMGAEGPLVTYGIPYLIWRASAMPANMFLLVAGGAFRGLGETTENLKNGVLVGIINLVLDYLLIFPCGLGIAGAAIATSIAQWCGCIYYAIKLYLKRNDIGLSVNSFLKMKLSDIRDFTESGLPLLFRQICNLGAWTLMASAATRMGVVQIAAHQLILQVWLIIAFVQDSVGSAGQVLVSKYMGALSPSSTIDKGNKMTLNEHQNEGNYTIEKSRLHARNVAKRVLSISGTIGISLAIVGRMFGPTLIRSVCDLHDVVELVLSITPMILCAFPMCCLVWTWDSLFYGAFDFLYNAKVVGASASLSSVFVVLSIKRDWGLKGIWFAMIYLFFGVRLFAHINRFNSHQGPFGSSTSNIMKNISHYELTNKNTTVANLDQIDYKS